MRRIAILGGGPSALFILKRLIEFLTPDTEIMIFERNRILGAGMPYSKDGACVEHITNVSGNEIPHIVTPITEWIKAAPHSLLKKFNIEVASFHEYEVVPRLLFGEYLAAQFGMLLEIGRSKGFAIVTTLDTTVADIHHDKEKNKVIVYSNEGEEWHFDYVIIATGHHWPKSHEGSVPNWFDSPYPPSKLAMKLNTRMAIRGSSLTAIDALRTVAHSNGTFTPREDGMLNFHLNPESKGLKIDMYSLKGLLPAIRFHLDDPSLSRDTTFSEEEINAIREANDGFVPLDLIFDEKFKRPIQEHNPAFYEAVRHMKMEEFVEHVMAMREQRDPFHLFKEEYKEAKQSIRRKESIYWKEELAVLSYVINYPAKYFSAEDMLRLKEKLMPLIAIIIAFVPQGSCQELLALYDTGILSLIDVDKDSEVKPLKEGGALYTYTDENGEMHVKKYSVFIDAVGQRAFMYEEFPFKSLLNAGSVSPAALRFKDQAKGEQEWQDDNRMVRRDSSGRYFLNVPGININDNFQVLDSSGTCNERVYMMAVPYMGGLNPDYSGLDFCERASEKIVKGMLAAVSSHTRAEYKC